jgi:hypothetical protein
MRRLNRSLFFIFPVLSSTNIFKNSSWFRKTQVTLGLHAAFNHF